MRADAREGDVGRRLRAIAAGPSRHHHRQLSVHGRAWARPNTNLVVRSRDPHKLAAAMAAVKAMLAELKLSLRMIPKKWKPVFG